MFETYCDYLIEKNKVMNLTAVTEPGEVEIKHFIDSSTGVPVIKSLIGANSANIVDIGTGAGFPGIPLAILMPEYNFELYDSLNKRINFLNEVINLLNLKNTSAKQARAEDLGQSVLRETYDICVSRAVAEMRVLLEYCLPMIKVGGYTLLYKSGEIDEELINSKKALEILGGEVININKFFLPETDISRSLIIVKKIYETPKKYPRRAGKPQKSPIN